MLQIILNASKKIKAHISAVTGQHILHDFDQTLYDNGQVDVDYLKWYAQNNDTIYIATHGSFSDRKRALIEPYFKNIQVVKVECKYVCDDMETGETVVIDEDTMNNNTEQRYIPVCDEKTCMPMIIKIIKEGQVLVDNHAAMFAKYATEGTYIEKVFSVKA